MEVKRIIRLLFSGSLISASSVGHARSEEAADLVRIEGLYAQAALDPFSAEKVDTFVNAVHENRLHWLDTVGGRRALKRADKLLAINLVKQRLDGCLGYDTLSRDASRKIILATARADAELCHGKFPFPVAVKDLTNLADLFGKRSFGEDRNFQNLLVFLTFRNMSEKALRLEQRWRRLLEDSSRSPDLIERICEKRGCDPGQRAALNALKRSEMYYANGLGLGSRRSAEVVNDLKEATGAMTRALYAPERSYHVSHAKDVAGSFRWQSYRFSPKLGDAPDALITRFGAGLTRNPLPAGYDKAPVETLDQISRDVNDELPESFRTAQRDINENPVAELLSRGRPDWQNALGYGKEPRAVPTPGRTYEVRLGESDEGGRAKITPDEITATREAQLNLVAGKLREVAMFHHDAQKATVKGKKVNYDDMLKKLVVAAPDAVGAALLTYPPLVDVLCRTIKQIAKEEKSKELKEWALAGATITSAAATGGFAAFGRQALASASGAGLAAATAAETISSLKEGVDSQEIAAFQQAQCYSAKANDASCNAARDSLSKAVTSFTGAGFAAVGALPFTSAAARLARGSVGALNESLKRLPSVAQAIKAMGSSLSIRLGTSGTAELAAALSAAKTEDLSAIVRNVRGMTDEGRELFMRRLGRLREARACAI